MNKEQIIFQDLGKMPYQAAWDYQEKLLQENVKKKSTVGGATTHRKSFTFCGTSSCLYTGQEWQHG